MVQPSPPKSARPLTIAVLVAVALWGLVLAIGAGLELSEPQGGDLRKFALVLGTTGGFLLFWGGLLGWRSWRLRRAARHAEQPANKPLNPNIDPDAKP